MRKFWFAFLLFLFTPTKTLAVDLMISDPLVTGLEISVNASLSATANYYLQGTLRSQTSSKYFGETQNGKGDFIDYVSSPEKEYIASNFFVTDVKNASWSGMVKLRFKLDDPNYLGPGIYDLKLRRFTGGSSSSAGESSTIAVNLSVALPIPSPSPTITASLAPSPSPTPSPTITPTPTPKPSPSPLPSPSLLDDTEATVAGISTEIALSGYGNSPAPSLQGLALQAPSLNRSRLKTVLLIGSGLIILSIASFFGYRRYLRLKGSVQPKV